MNRRWLLCSALVAGCATPEVGDYRQERPELDLRRYFNGALTGYGVFTDFKGRVRARFVVDMVGRWNGDEGVLEEEFRHADGRKDRRVWRLEHRGDGRYIGRAEDVVGQAQGEAAGNALRWAYTLRLPVDGTVYEVQFDDWMYLVDEQVMLNKAEIRKFGFRLGEVTLAFFKRP